MTTNGKFLEGFYFIVLYNVFEFAFHQPKHTSSFGTNSNVFLPLTHVPLTQTCFCLWHQPKHASTFGPKGRSTFGWVECQPKHTLVFVESSTLVVLGICDQ